MTDYCKYGDPFCPCQDGDPCHYEPPNPLATPIERLIGTWPDSYMEDLARIGDIRNQGQKNMETPTVSMLALRRAQMPCEAFLALGSNGTGKAILGPWDVVECPNAQNPQGVAYKP